MLRYGSGCGSLPQGRMRKVPLSCAPLRIRRRRRLCRAARAVERSSRPGGGAALVGASIALRATGTKKKPRLLPHSRGETNEKFAYRYLAYRA